MAGKVTLAVVPLVAALVLVSSGSLADHRGCPPFERLRYDFYLEQNHGGDLYSTLHVVGYTVFRFCFEARDHVTQEDIRWEARGGEYMLRVMGPEVDETHVLHAGQNKTAWYEHAAIESVQIVGLSSRAEITFVPHEPPPAMLDALRLT